MISKDITRALFPEQKDALRLLQERDGKAGLFMEMGTGKTRTALIWVSFRKCKRILVVCPISVVGVWEREARLIDFELPVVDLAGAGSIRDRAATLRKTGASLVLINYESYWRNPLRQAIEKWKPDAVIFDEAHRLRNRGSRHSRFSHVLHDRGIPNRLALTGTPIVNGLQDVWSIYRFIDPRVFGSRWADFAMTYLRMGGFRNQQIKGYQNVSQAEALISGTSFQAKKRADLPERQDIIVPIKLTPDTRKTYETLAADAIARISDEGGEEHTILARIVLTLLIRLQQITSGFVRAEGGEEPVTISSEKVDATIDLLTDAVEQRNKVVVFARFLHDVDRIMARMPRGVRAVRFTGRESGRERKAIESDFLAGKYDVIVGQLKAASLGVNFTPASVAIFTSVGFSLDDFLQAKDRLHREGQTRPVSYYHLIAEDTVDEKVYEALRSKMSIANRVTSLSYALDLLNIH